VLDFARFDYAKVTDKAIDTALSLIDYYDLHSQPYEPVPLSRILDKFDLRFMDLPDTTCGFTLDVERKIIIALNNRLSTELTRYVAMHEVGHVACWHPNQLNACAKGEGLYDRLETEATTVAAYVLIPQAAIADPLRDTAEEISTCFIVPPELVLIRRALYIRKGV